MITSCKEITIAAFRICMFRSDLSPLGEGSLGDQEAAWLSIRSEYYVLLKAPGIAAMIEQLTEINEMASRIERLQFLVQICRMYEDERLAEALRSEGFPLDLPVTKPDEIHYQQQLTVVLARLAPMKMRLAGMLKEIPVETTEHDAAALEHSESEFERAIIVMSRFMGFSIDEEKTSMYRLCNIATEMSDRIKAQNQITQKEESTHG